MRDLDAFLQKLLPEMGKAKTGEVLLKSYVVYQVGKYFAVAMEERAHYAAVCNLPRRESGWPRHFAGAWKKPLPSLLTGSPRG